MYTPTKTFGVLLVLLVLLAVCLFGQIAYAKYGGGSGTVEDPYQIATAADLIALGYSDKHFILTADIDLSGNIWSGAVIPYFSGTCDGRGHVVRNLRIIGEGDLGLFGQLAESAQVENLGLTNVNVVGSENFVGGLIGWNSGSVVCCYSSGAVAGMTEVGGLVGHNDGNVHGCYSAGAVIGAGGFVGGLVGCNYYGTVRCSYSTCAVTSADDFAGGLLGYNDGGYVMACYNAGTVTGKNDTDFVGGVVGNNDEEGIVSNCYNTGMVKAVSYVGGLVGWNEAAVVNSYSTGVVTGNSPVGGLVGCNTGTVKNSFWDIQASGCANSEGGTGLNTAQMKDIPTYVSAGWDFIGESANGIHEIWQMPERGGYPLLSILNGYQPPQLEGKGTPDSPYLISTAAELGAVIWHNPGACYRLCADIDLSGICWSTSIVPWFSGKFDGNNLTIRNVTITGGDYLGFLGILPTLRPGRVYDLGVVDVNIVGSGSYVGGLVGYTEGSLTNCYCTGSVSGSGNYVGGLVGGNRGDITQCYTTGSVTGESRVGGLVGLNGAFSGAGGGDVINSYSRSTVTGVSRVGGLVGSNDSAIEYCYSTGVVTGNFLVGGLVGLNFGSVKNSFWDTQTSGQTNSAGGTRKTTAEMQTASTFLEAGWDFVRIWQMQDGVEYPSFLPRLKGKGTIDKPYLISTAAELAAVVLYNSAACYRLTANIDLSGRTWPRAVIPSFGGTFDGNGLTIHNLTIACDSESEDGPFGLFGVLSSGAQVKDLGVVDVNVDVKIEGYWPGVGAIVGWNLDGIITNCYSTGSVTGESDVGGLAGAGGGTTNCCSTCTVSGTSCVGGLVGSGGATKCYATGSVSGNVCVGGLVGLSSWVDVVNCYSTGTVTGNTGVGGLVGYSSEGGALSNCYSTGAVYGNRSVGGLVGETSWVDVVNCYSTGVVKGKERVGGLVGYQYPGLARNSFWDIQTSGCNASDGGAGRTTAQMQTATTFLNAGWDFVGESQNGTKNIWAICEGRDYPKLAWQFIVGDFNADYKVDLHDLAVLSMRWRLPDSSFFWCRGPDLTDDGFIDFEDLMELAGNWLTGVAP